MKTCSSCGETKEVSEFRRKGNQCRACYNAYQMDWYRSHREQVTQRWRDQRASDPETVRAKERAYWDAHPDGKHAKDARSKAKDPERGRQNARDWRAANLERANAAARDYYAAHKEERSAYQVKYAEFHKEKISARGHAYYEANRDRLIQYARDYHEANRAKHAIYARHRKVLQRAKVPIVFHSEDEWVERLAWFGGGCAYCDTTENIVRDHILALANGGDDAISNIQPLCISCNSRKERRSR